MAFNPKITAQGLTAFWNAQNTGVQLELTHVGFGTAAYNPTGNETAPAAEVKRVPIGAGSRLTDSQIRIAAIWASDSEQLAISEINFYAGTVLFAVLSRESGGPFVYKTLGSNLIFSYDWTISQVPAAGITVSVDPDSMALLVHLADADAHPQYLTIAEYNRRDHKNSVRVATTGNITLSGLQVIDGVSLAAGDRVLVKNQTTARNNGIYVVVAGGAWIRAEDADTSQEVTPGMQVPVEQGSVNAASIWQLVTDSPISLGSTSLSFEIAVGPSGVNPGTYRSVTVDKRGRVTSGTNPKTLAGYEIEDAQPLSALLSSYVENNRFGLGGRGIPLPGGDANLIENNGFYYILSSSLNVPQVSSGHMLLHISFDASNAAQLFFSRFGAVMSWRSKSSGVWGDWSEIWHSGNMQKQSGTADATAGALMTVGAFGLGGDAVAVASADLNTYTKGGKYLTPASGLTNIPPGWSAAVRYQVEVIGGGSNVTQTIVQSGAALGSELKMAVRWNNGSGWSSWAEILDAGRQQATADDATAGRLLTVGAFGLGSDTGILLGANKDLNTVTRSGLYGQTQNVNATLALNYPDTAAGTLLVQSAGTSITTQIYIRHNSSRMWVRSLVSGSWSAWAEAWTTANLAKQANASDQTAGALMQVGAFGLGGSGVAVPNGDCDQITGSGFYALASATTNAFPGKVSGDALLHVAYTATYAMQIGGSRSGRVYARYNNNGSWTAWTELLRASDKQSDAADATAGALLTTGAFGLGSTAIAAPSDDLNAITSSGFYSIMGSTLNRPAGVIGSSSCLHIQISSNYAQQLVISRSTDAMFFRRRSGSTWSDWREIYHNGNLPAQAAADDATPGRLLTVGAFGLGSDTGILLGANKDLNTVTKSGFYGQNATANATLALNYPTAAAGTLLVQNAGGSITTQIYIRLNNSQMWFRSLYGTWTEWREIYHSGNLSPVETTRQVLAGNGLTGGGSLAADRTLTLGTPGTLSGNTSNGVTASSHTHAIAAATATLQGVIELATAGEVAAGDSTRAVTGATLIAGLLGLGNMTPSGYVIIPYRDASGNRQEFIVQWLTTGEVTNSMTPVQMNWPTSFPNACLGTAIADTGTSLSTVKGWKVLTDGLDKNGVKVMYANIAGGGPGYGRVLAWGN